MARMLLLVLICCFSVALAACGDDEKSSSSTGQSTPAAAATDTPSPEAAATEDGGETTAACEKAADPKPRPEGKLAKPKDELDPSKTYVAEVITTCGEFEITLDAERAPKTGGSFAYLAKEGFFDGLKFHRIIAGFVIQAGDPQGTGQGGPGYSVVEAPPEDLVYTKGIVAMAKTQLEDPGTSGSQFFVVTAEDAGLPPEYALVGKVTKGMDVVDKIGVVKTRRDEQPIDPVVIQQVKIVEK
jgi:cyclophilin family peptidyl-prolyl cis-trans isomerase